MFPMNRVLLLVLAALQAAAAATLHINAIGDNGERVWARYEVQDVTGAYHQAPAGIVDQTSQARQQIGERYLKGFIAQGPFEMQLPAGEYTVLADRGPEYEPVEMSVTLTEDAPTSLSIELKRWIRMLDTGWWSADFHVHQDVPDVQEWLEAQDVNLAVVMGMWGRRDYWFARPLPGNNVEVYSPERRMSLGNAEDSRSGGVNAMHLLRKKVDMESLGPWSPTSVDVIRQATSQRYVPAGFPWVDMEKPFWKESPVVMALATPNSIGLLHSHFLKYGVMDYASWGRQADARIYPGRDGFVNYSLDLVYRYWNLGFDVPPSAGSGSGELPNPVGYNRLYVHMNEPFTMEGFYRNLRQGRSFVTNGPMLFFDAYEINGNQIMVNLDVQSRGPLDRVEIIADGKVVQTFEAPEGRTSFQTDVAIRSGIHRWVAVRAFEKSDDTVVMAHSRPIFFNGAWRRTADADYFIAWIDELIQETEEAENRFATEEEKQTALETYREARAVYQRLR